MLLPFVHVVLGVFSVMVVLVVVALFVFGLLLLLPLLFFVV